MKKVTTLGLLFSMLAFSADGGAFAGKWQLAISVGGTDREFACTLTQTGAEVGGTCQTDSGTVKISGKAEDKKVSFAFKSEYSGNPLTVSFSGSLQSEDKMSGSVSVEEMGVGGDFSAVRSK